MCNLPWHCVIENDFEPAHLAKSENTAFASVPAAFDKSICKRREGNHVGEISTSINGNPVCVQNLLEDGNLVRLPPKFRFHAVRDHDGSVTGQKVKYPKPAFHSKVPKRPRVEDKGLR